MIMDARARECRHGKSAYLRCASVPCVARVWVCRIEDILQPVDQAAGPKPEESVLAEVVRTKLAGRESATPGTVFLGGANL